MFFDNKKFFNFVNTCRAEGIEVPIIPGLKPITTKAQLHILPRTFSIDLPMALSEAIEQCKTDSDVEKIGIEWAIQQSKELMQFGVPCIHFFTMGKSKAVRTVAENIY